MSVKSYICAECAKRCPSCKQHRAKNQSRAKRPSDVYRSPAPKGRLRYEGHQHQIGNGRETVLYWKDTELDIPWKGFLSKRPTPAQMQQFKASFKAGRVPPQLYDIQED